MRLVQLKADNFRRFTKLSLSTSDRLNLFVGANAAGKTSLLEMIYCLNRGKSFRGSAHQDLLGPAKPQWTVFGRYDAQGSTHAAGLQWSSEVGIAARRDGKPASATELLGLAPTQILEPGMHRMIAEGPTYRRSFIDWGVFHVEPRFLPTWRRYRRALRQRNQLLREQRKNSEIAAWEPELAESGEALHQFRLEHLRKLRDPVRQRITQLLDEGDWSFDLLSGWSSELSLRDDLERHRERDRRMGLTQGGPHRAELRIRAGKQAIRHRISRGQQKLVLAAMLISQCEQIRTEAGVAPILLIDDFTAELADRYQSALFQELKTYPGQVFLSAFERTSVLQDSELHLFHVEHGTVKDSGSGA